MTKITSSPASRGVTSGKERKRSKEEIILLLMCALSIPSILPFGIYRILQHAWLPATIDMVIVGGVSSVMAYVWWTRKVRLASLLVTIFYSMGMVAAIYVKGVNLVYWTYPTMISAFFLLRPNTALAINGCALLALIAILFPQIPLLNLFTITITFILVNLFAYIFSHRTAIQHNELNRDAENDFLTGVGNRRALEKYLARCVARAADRPESSLLLLDIDHFKQINDRFGHAVGDTVLVDLCQLLRTRARARDRIFRYGGEEFVIIADATDLKCGTRFAEDLRMLVEDTVILEDYPITISIGVACIVPGESVSEWLDRADRMLYLAKQSGRNAVRISEQIE